MRRTYQRPRLDDQLTEECDDGASELFWIQQLTFPDSEHSPPGISKSLAVSAVAFSVSV
jgi:hypothetical protein